MIAEFFPNQLFVNSLQSSMLCIVDRDAHLSAYQSVTQLCIRAWKGISEFNTSTTLSILEYEKKLVIFSNVWLSEEFEMPIDCSRCKNGLVCFSSNIMHQIVWPLWMQMKKYYQPRKSHRTVLVDIEGTKVPLYGAGSNLVESVNGVVRVPLTLDFWIRSRGDVVGKLVRTKHRRHVSCSLVIDSTISKPIKFLKDSCVYRWPGTPLLLHCNGSAASDCPASVISVPRKSGFQPWDIIKREDTSIVYL